MIESEAEARAFVAARCDDRAMRKFERLIVLLREENMRQNLVAARSFDEVWLRHIADSVQLLDHAGSERSVWLDLGTGAGFPGIALAIARPDQHFHLVESRKRRVEWLASVKADLKLENCTIHGARLEHVESFDADCITARAFAPLPRLLDLSARFSTKETRWILPKGRSAAQEVGALPKKRRALFHVEHSQTDAQAGIITGSGRIEAKP
ncbi:16S rRNA (guanine(527)-N(7))-methyltransferase RsmG [Qipengyuania pelagi]|uniref:Ribosomal RNA small subunit methyltransferase G n=1 Tax=Qipengyuania pelagi TaxID=994320 RepID=A0A844YBZ6_9SPHN|nr:16S rRNA (guanine(527)-N(7))-methyltransferase RsmG [Qipengyuania pelagi]MXO54763.1 16S rRNA (guanine(527)-N(7))-methyltransferase RsmG [Qipengyuania pelagi]